MSHVDLNSMLPADLLEGVRILDLTNVLSGPFCTYQMALLGAEVIKIENPVGGDLARQLGADKKLNKQFMGTSFLAQNAGKKSITLNLKTDKGVSLFKKLVKTSDVVVENFRPDVMKRLKLDYHTLKEINPKIIYCAISGFGQNGPLKNNPAYDQIIQGLSGVMSITGEEAKNTAPLRVGFPLCDTVGGLTAAFAIVSTLLKRDRTGTGLFIDVSMLESTLVMLGWVISNYLSAGIAPTAMGNQNITAAPSGAFQTGKGLINIAANKQEQYEKLCALLNREDLKTDEKFSHPENRKQNRELLNAELTRSLLEQTAEYWEEVFNKSGIPAGRVLSVPEILEHPQIKSRSFIQEFKSSILESGIFRVTRAGFKLSDCEPTARSTPPELGADTAEILARLDIDADKLSSLKAEGVI
jgi:CoA:oxalate CoA-transferase